MTLVRTLGGCAAALAGMAVLSLGGIASADQPQQQVDASVCAEVQAAIAAGDTTVGDLPETLAVKVEAALGAGADLGVGDPLTTVLAGLDCTETGQPSTTPAPTTGAPAPTSEQAPPSAEPPFVDRDCADLAPGEAEQILRADPSDPNRLDANRNGVPCELDDIARENERPSSTVPTPGSGSNAQFDAMPSFAPQTGRA